MNTDNITADEFIADLSSVESVRAYLGGFATEYSEDGIDSIAEAYANVLAERKDEIADALAGLTEGQPVTEVTERLGLTHNLDVAIQAAQ